MEPSTPIEQEFANWQTCIIDLDVEVRGSLTVAQAHEIAKKIEQTIKENVLNVYDIMVHVEPLGNIEKQERYGLSRND